MSKIITFLGDDDWGEHITDYIADEFPKV